MDDTRQNYSNSGHTVRSPKDERMMNSFAHAIGTHLETVIAQQRNVKKGRAQQTSPDRIRTL
jgi:hypothetical protein